ncbi:hypothetical protein GEMRC1_008577 [Eukaryota sp. GEM-RC1]
MTELTVEQSLFDVSADQVASVCDIPYELKTIEQFGGVSGLLSSLRTDPVEGLSAEEESSGFEERRRHFGRNVLPEPPFRSFWSFFKEAMNDTTLKILMGAAIVSFILGIATEGLAEGWIEGTAILIAVLLVGVVTATNDYKKQLQFLSLSKKQQEKRHQSH